MENKEAKITLREAFKLNRRALALLIKTAPGAFAANTLSPLVKALAPYAPIYFSARLVNELAGGRDTGTLMNLALAVIFSTALLALLGAALNRWRRASYAAVEYISHMLSADKFLSMDFCSADDPHTLDLHSQIMQNRNWSDWGIERTFEQYEGFIGAAARIAGALALSVTLFTLPVPPGGELAVLNHPLAVALVAVLLLASALGAPALSNKAEGYWARYAEQATYGNRVFGFYGFMAVNERDRALDIRTYRQDILCRNKMLKEDIFGAGSLLAKWKWGPMGLLGAASAGISRAFAGVVYLFVCLKAWGGAFGIGSVTQYVAAVTALSGGIAKLFETFGDMRNNAPFLHMAFEFLDIPNDMYQGSLTVEKRSDCNYEVEFRNVSFRYPSAETYALKNVSLKFKVGEKLAVVGENGSGKTTMIKLLCRLYDPTEGEILLNGIDIRKYDYAEYMAIFSVVFQDFRLLALPLGQNVAARADGDPAKIKDCLDKAGFGGRLSEMEKGINACLYRDFDQKGVEISGGEAQKIAIARALYKDAPFIVLDEPTAALDPVAEAEIYEKFDGLVGDKTAIYISHRLSSCRFCDEILVFDKGRIVQHGSHEALVSNPAGKYYELWHSQAQYYAKKEAPDEYESTIYDLKH